MENAKAEKSPNFIHEIIEDDLKTSKYDGRVHTRFPPEPNGYLHIGHAKSICLNFGTAAKYKGLCNLRFDDTNPVKEDIEYVDSIMADVRWLGFDWEDRLFYASDYFEQLYQYGEMLITKGKAYVCDLTGEEISKYRGTVTQPGKDSPYRNRSVEENLDLFRRMRAGEFENGAKVLRAKIDMASPNMLLRDPVLYRILHTEHHRTGNKWCIYPMYDFAHGQSDSIEHITHSICTLEFEVHRPLYEWFIKELGIYAPQQIEFARLNLTYTVMSKRKLLQLVQDKHVQGWDDPRMPTISGLRRRGFTPESLRNFAEITGAAKRPQVVEYAMLEHCLREDLNKIALRRMAVLNPVKLVIENFPEDITEELEAVNNPEDANAGMRKIPFSKELYIDRDDFMESPPPKYFRLSPGNEVRLKYAYIIKCTGFEKDSFGNITEVRCTYEADTRSGMPNSNKKVKGTIHWVSVKHAVGIEARLYEHLFVKEFPEEQVEGKDFTDFINPESLKVVAGYAEPSVTELSSGTHCQFERVGYFCVDPDSKAQHIIFNRSVGLRDSWARTNK